MWGKWNCAQFFPDGYQRRPEPRYGPGYMSQRYPVGNGRLDQLGGEVSIPILRTRALDPQAIQSLEVIAALT